MQTNHAHATIPHIIPNECAYEIQRNIPLPTKKFQKPRALSPFSRTLRLLEVNESFEAPVHKSLSTILHQTAKKFNRKFTSRRVSDTKMRIWRIA